MVPVDGMYTCSDHSSFTSSSLCCPFSMSHCLQCYLLIDTPCCRGRTLTLTIAASPSTQRCVPESATSSSTSRLGHLHQTIPQHIHSSLKLEAESLTASAQLCSSISHQVCGWQRCLHYSVTPTTELWNSVLDPRHVSLGFIHAHPCRPSARETVSWFLALPCVHSSVSMQKD